MTSLQCVEAFSPAQPREEQNHEGYGPQSGQYLHNWGGVVTPCVEVKFGGLFMGFFGVERGEEEKIDR